jgi:predicted extracellular nuclease
MQKSNLLFPFAAIAVALAVPVHAQEIHIGAWNVEWLGFPDKRGKPGRDVAQTPVDLAEHIVRCKVDVLALEEIGVDQPHAPWTSKALDAVMKQLKDTHHQDWTYVLFPKTDYPAGTEDFILRGQHTGLAWCSSKASVVGETYAVPVGRNETYGIKFFERRANAVKLSFGEGKTDVVFVPIHLKSNRNDADPNDKNFTQKQRDTEIQSFLDHLDKLQDHFQDNDIVLLGDTNLLEPEDSGTAKLAEAGLIDLNAKDAGTTAAWGEGYSSAPFDRIFVPIKQPEFMKAVQVVHRTVNGTDEEIKDYKKRLSDHYLVSCIIEIGSDDD